MTSSQLAQLNTLSEVSCGFIWPKAPNIIYVMCLGCNIEEWCFSAVFASKFIRRHPGHETVVVFID